MKLKIQCHRAPELKEGHRAIQVALCGPPFFLCGLKYHKQGGQNAIPYSVDLISNEI